MATRGDRRRPEVDGAVEGGAAGAKAGEAAARVAGAEDVEEGHGVVVAGAKPGVAGAGPVAGGRGRRRRRRRSAVAVHSSNQLSKSPSRIAGGGGEDLAGSARRYCAAPRAPRSANSKPACRRSGGCAGCVAHPRQPRAPDAGRRQGGLSFFRRRVE